MVEISRHVDEGVRFCVCSFGISVCMMSHGVSALGVGGIYTATKIAEVNSRGRLKRPQTDGSQFNVWVTVTFFRTNFIRIAPLVVNK